MSVYGKKVDTMIERGDFDDFDKEDWLLLALVAALCYARTEPTELESTDDLRGAAIDFARAFGEVVK